MKYLKHLKSFHQEKKFDVWLLSATILLTIFGIIMIYEASNVAAHADFGDKFHYVKDHLLFIIIGVITLLITSHFNYKKYYYIAVPLLIITILSLLAVFIPGIGIKALGARRWIGMGFINYQPSELAKMAVIIYLSNWLIAKEKKRLASFIILMGLILTLIILQPDLGTTIIIASVFMIVYFLSGAPIWQFLLLIPVVILSTVALIFSSSYRFNRLTTFYNPNFDPLGASYHIRQILISLGSGGWIGRGLGASRGKYQYLPEATTDSIFAIIGEEFGFIGSVFIILIYIFFLYRIFLIVRQAPDRLSYLLSGGIFALFGMQILINLGAITALFPLTGIPLPFISYGGSNLIISLTLVGIVSNISRYKINKK